MSSTHLPRRRLPTALVILASLGVAAIGALVISLSIERRLDVTLPLPTGRFAVGRAIFDWKDDATVDRLAPDRDARRELLVWIWYPAARSATDVVDEYEPATIQAASKAAGGSTILGLITRDLSKVHEHSLRDAAVSPQERVYPVAI